MTFAAAPNTDAMVVGLPSCCGLDRPAKYPPITAGAHLLQRLWETTHVVNSEAAPAAVAAAS